MGFPIMHHYSRLLTLDMEDKHNIWCVISGIDGDLLHCINPLVTCLFSLFGRALSRYHQLRSQTRLQPFLALLLHAHYTKQKESACCSLSCLKCWYHNSWRIFSGVK